MPLFQQVAHNAYDALPESRFIKRGLIARERKAKKLIHKSPRRAKGYLDLAKVYIEDNNLRAALKAYNDGIRNISIALEIFMMDNTNSDSSIDPSKPSEHKIRKNTIQQKTTGTIVSTWILRNKSKSNDSNNDGFIIAQQQKRQQQEDLLILKKERENTLTILVRHSHQFHQSLPYDILYQIFGYLKDNFDDLYQCAHTCKRWCQFMITWPPFWNQLSPAEIALENKSTVVVVDPYKPTHGIYLNNLIHSKINDILGIIQPVVAEELNSIEMLSFKNINMSETQADLLGKVLESMNGPHFKQTEIINCNIPTRKTIATLASCSHLTHLTFKEHLTGWGSNYDRYSRKAIESQVFLSLTYLKLCIGKSGFVYNQDNDLSSWVIRHMVSQSPNLMHFFADSRGTKVYLGSYGSTVFENCPRIRTVVLGNDAEMPDDIILNGIVDDQKHEKNKDDNNDINRHPVLHNDTTSTDSFPNRVSHLSDNGTSVSLVKPVSTTNTISKKTTLCQFVYLRSPIYYGEAVSYFSKRNSDCWNYCFSTFTELSRDSLQLLYVLYDGISAKHLHQWCEHGTIAPNLRELQLTIPEFKYGGGVVGKPIQPGDKYNGILGKLLRCLPVLEVLVVKQSKPYHHASYNNKQFLYSEDYLFVDDFALQKLAIHCHHIRHIKITGFPFYTSEAVLLLAKEKELTHPSTIATYSASTNTALLPITYLEMDIPRDIVLQLVKKINSLKTLCIRMDRLDSESPGSLDTNDRIEVEHILRERGGSLKFAEVPITTSEDM